MNDELWIEELFGDSSFLYSKTACQMRGCLFMLAPQVLLLIINGWRKNKPSLLRERGPRSGGWVPTKFWLYPLLAVFVQTFSSYTAHAAEALPLSWATKEAKRSFFVDTALVFLNIPLVRLQHQTTKRIYSPHFMNSLPLPALCILSYSHPPASAVSAAGKFRFNILFSA